MEEFILKVRNHPCLWDNNHVYFRDVARKNAAWDSVAQECGICGVTEAKSLWKRLRDSHREAMRRRKISQVLAPWKYEDIMEFLLPQNPSVEYQHENDEASVSEEDENKIIIDNEPTDSRRVPMYVKVQKRDNFLEELEEKEKLEKRRTENERRRTELRNYAIDRSRSANDEALKDLFSGLCQKTIQLPKHLQLRVQREVFDAVLKAEEEALSLEYTGGGFERSSVIEEPGHSKVRVKKEKASEDSILIT